MPDGNRPSPHRFGSVFDETPLHKALTVRKVEAFGLLDRAGQMLEPAPSQMERAETSYGAVADWLAGTPLLSGSVIYVQGSAAHGTMVKPLTGSEHDVDLICRVPGYGPTMRPHELKALVGDRLKEHAAYASRIEEKLRCWRLNYAGDFHLDITPAILNPNCPRGGELVPDRSLRAWKPSNPPGFRDLFARRAALQPMRTLAKTFDEMVRAEVQPFPTTAARKGVLRRTVQLAKRHRDLHFRKAPELAPLSIIITSLCARAYEHCAREYPYDNELDLLCDTLRAMTWFIERYVDGQAWLVRNETTDGENFAEKWNGDVALPRAFEQWQAKALADFEALAAAEGLDEIERRMAVILGEEPVRKVLDGMAEEVSGARRNGSLSVVPSRGLATAGTLGAAIPRHTFFGR